MFVKKDLRKIPKILADAMENNDNGIETPTATTDSKNSNNTEVLTELRLARRPTEFKAGNIKDVLCKPHYIPALYNLVSISLYDCQIRNIDGIGFFASRTPINTNSNDQNRDEDVEMEDINKIRNHYESGSIVCPFLEELNLGRNPIEDLPSELGLLSKSLKRLWLDDCQLKASLPESLYELGNLELLRISNNGIVQLEGTGVSKWQKLENLNLDGNNIESIPDELVHLKKLKSLFLRNNKLTRLPEGLGLHQNLTLLHISSNQLASLPHSISQCVSLKKLYANGNRIDSIPEKFFQNLENLELCNLSNNNIKTLSPDFIEQFGHPNDASGIYKKAPDCAVILEQNPVLNKTQSTQASQ